MTTYQQTTGDMIAMNPAKSPRLAPAAVGARQMQAGADLAHLKPMRIQPPTQVMDLLLAMSRQEPAPA